MRKIYFGLFICLLFIISAINANADTLDKDKEWKNFKDKCGDKWQINWNNKTNTPHMIFGSSCDIINNQGKKIKDKDNVEAISKDTIKEMKSLLNIDESKLKVLKIEEGNNEWYVEHQQYYNDVPVEGAKVSMTISENGELVIAGADFYNDINIDTNPTIDEEEAISIAKEYIQFDDTPDDRPDFINQTISINITDENGTIREINKIMPVKVNKMKKEVNSTLIILPYEKEDGYDYSLVWKIRLYSTNPLIHKEIFIDAQNRQILKEINLVRENFNVYGYIYGYIYPLHPTDTPQLNSFNYLRNFIAVYDEDLTSYDWVGAPAISTGSSNYYDTGTFIDNCAGSYDSFSCADPQVDAYLYGDYVATTNNGGTDYYYSTPSLSDLSGSGRLDIFYAANDETNCYYHTNYVHNFFKSSPFNYNGMDYQMQCYVNDGPSTNGKANGFDMWYGSNGGLQWVREADVIYHEYTHNTIYHIYGGFIGLGCSIYESEAMDEGLADFFSVTITGDPIQGISSYTRDLSVDWNYLTDYDSTLPADCHENGKIISSTLWDIRNMIGVSTTNRLVFEALRNVPHPDTFAETFDNILIEDDNNANLCDGTPNGVNIFSAFKNHGMDFNNGPWADINDVSTVLVNSDDIELLCVGGDTCCKTTKWYYFDSDGVCSTNKADYVYSTTSNWITVNTNHNDYLCLWVEDNLGDYNTYASTQLKVDATPPTITIRSPLNTWYSSSTIMLNISIGENGKWINVSIDSGPVQNKCNDCGGIAYNLLSLTDGTHTATVYASDYAGNVATKAVEFYIDTIYPSVLNYNYANGTYITGTSAQTFTVTYTETNTDKVELYWNGTWPFACGIIGNCPPVALSSCPSGSNVQCSANIDLSSYTEGSTIAYYFGVYDKTGKSSYRLLPGNKPYTVIVDRLPPTVTISLPENGKYYPASILNASVSAGEKVSWIKQSLDGGSNVTKCSDCTSYYIENGLGPLSEGAHNLTVYASDYSGKTASYTVTFYIDTTYPAIINYNPSNGTYISGSSSQTFTVSYTEINLRNVSLSWRVLGAPIYNVVYLTGCPAGTNKECSTNIDLSSYPEGTIIEYFFAVYDPLWTVALWLPDGKPYNSIIDRLPPTVSISSPENGKYYPTDTININVTAGEKVASVKQSLDGGSNITKCNDCTSYYVENGLGPLSEGAHTLTVYAQDYSGKIGTDTKLFYIDAVRPNILSYNYANGTYIDGSNAQTFSVTYTESQLTRVALNWKEESEASYKEVNLTGCNAGTSQGCSVNIDLSPYTENKVIQYYFVVYDHFGSATLFAGAGEPYVVIIDRLVPTITISLPENEKYYGVSALNESAAAGEKVKWIKTSIDGGANITRCNDCMSHLLENGLGPLSEGKHNVTTYASDYSGKVASNSVVFYIDSIIPKITSQTPSDCGWAGVLDTINFTVTYTETNLTKVMFFSKKPGLSAYSNATLTGCESGIGKSCSILIDFSSYSDNETVDYFFAVFDNASNSISSRVVRTLNDGGAELSLPSAESGSSCWNKCGSHWKVMSCNETYYTTKIRTILVDKSPPTSSVNALSQYQNQYSFDVSWSGTDGGSGLAIYDIEVNDNNTGWIIWQDDIPVTSATFTGAANHVYQFKSKAKDNIGNVETKTDQDTNTTMNIAEISTNINLPVGWNLISIPLQVANHSVGVVLKSIDGSYDDVWAYNASDATDSWKEYVPGAPGGNDLMVLDEKQGLWVRVTSSSILVINGTQAASTQIGLVDKWNLVGYPTPTEKILPDALNGVNYDDMWAYNASDSLDYWKEYVPGAPGGNDLTRMSYGQGYWVRSTGTNTWTVNW